ncbi:MAG: thrombospondin type 3 repeat-containing protein [Myxococcales bacterium]|nr:thrombospondin type 3 repeat-containing protein [Myxococcales bacterium]
MRVASIWLAPLAMLGVGSGCDSVFGFHDGADAGDDALGCAIGHDEDADGVDDGCDNCPQTPNPTQSDHLETDMGSVADGVGDACDPHPTVAGDRVESFLSFAAPGISETWRSPGASTTFDGDALVFGRGVMGAAVEQRMLVDRPLELDVVISITSISDLSVVAAVVDADDNGEGSRCELVRQTSDVDHGYIVVPHQPDATKVTPLTVVEGKRYLVTVRYDRRFGIECAYVPDPTVGAAVQGSLTFTSPAPPGKLAFTSLDIGARIESAIIYTW